MKLAALCAKYLEDFPKTRGTKRAILVRLQGDPIGKVKAPGRSKDYIEHCMLRRRTVSAATAYMDLSYLKGVLQYAKVGWDMANVSATPLIEAMPVLRQRGLIGSSERRTTTPTDEQVRAIVAWVRNRYGDLHADVMEFQYPSGRRISETTRLMWGDMNGKTVLVRDMKHPRKKEGNHVRVALPDEAFDIIQRQPRLTSHPEERIFKIKASAVQHACRMACNALGYEGMHIHAFRRGTVTMLLKRRYPPAAVMLVTGQRTMDMVMNQYNGLTAEDFHNMRPS